ncbi:tetratricopeptide repeat protein, partial [Candidatus Saccharibacteria bacterium]|nr:tetratricopeptide repeat protein [Candidatus Saccharibacteria bacterium]
PRAHNNLATYFYDERFLNKAIEHMRIALEYWPENPHFHANLGSIYLKKGNVDKSIEHLETAVKLAPADLFARQ